MTKEKLYILYDMRAVGFGTEEATVFCTASSKKEALEDAQDFRPCAIYECDVEGDKLTNETLWRVIMDREIKFRGKDIDGIWAYGSLVYRNGMPVIIVYAQTWKCINAARYEEVSPETVGQYTGLKDKNGVEIYEGAIVRVISRQDSCIGPVVFNECAFVFVIPGCDDFEIPYRNLTGWVSIEIIGNKFDNPELLEAR